MEDSHETRHYRHDHRISVWNAKDNADRRQIHAQKTETITGDTYKPCMRKIKTQKTHEWYPADLDDDQDDEPGEQIEEPDADQSLVVDVEQSEEPQQLDETTSGDPAETSVWYPAAPSDEENEPEEQMEEQDADPGRIADDKLPAELQQPDETETGDSDQSVAGHQHALEETFAKAVELVELGVEGDKGAVKKAYELFKKMHEADPDNPLIEAYYGNVITLLGRDAFDPMERFKLVIKGLDILDNAVSKEPETIQIRILRGKVCHRIPQKFFHRTTTAIEDFKYLVSRYEQDPGIFSPGLYKQLLNDLKDAYQRLGWDQEAESISRKIASLTDPNQQNENALQDAQNDKDASEPEDKLPDLDKDEILQKGIKLHELAHKGDKEALQLACDLFKKATKAYPDDQLLKAYYADCFSLTARDKENYWEAFAAPQKAKKILDKAVNSDPDNIQIRLLRAYHSFRLPEAFFSRTTTAMADFKYLIQRYESDNSVLARETYWQLLYDMGLAYRQLDLEEEAWATWEKLLSLNPDPKYKTMIEKERKDNLVKSPEKYLTPENRDLFYREGFRLHELAVAGNRKAVKMALELWQKAYEKNPDDAVARAYYGSSLALVGRDSPDISKLFQYTFKGMKQLDRAIELDPNNVQIRVLRARLAYALPQNLFYQAKKAVIDFEYLKKAYEQDNSIFSREFYHRILYDLGVVYQRLGDEEKAQEVWLELLDKEPDPKYKELINKRNP